jgi:two-component system cell cycle sensor histidine kinase/response regulator CckA
MPFAHWNRNWRAAGFWLGAALTAALALAGQAQLARALLAGAGAGLSMLIASGHLGIQTKESRTEARMREVLRAVPAAIAITGRKGIVLWASEAFLELAGSPEPGGDLSRLGEGEPEAAAALFRLFASARDGEPHEETVAIPRVLNGETVLLRVAPFCEPGERPQFLIWHVESTRKKRAIVGPGGCDLESLPVPAFAMSKELIVEAVNRSFEELLGSCPVGAQAWPFLRTGRGKAYTRAWLRDAIAKAEPRTVQIVNASGSTRTASLHVSANARNYVCLAMPTEASGGLEEAFETLLARAPAPLALTNAKGVIQAANPSFRELFKGEVEDSGEGFGLRGKPLASLMPDMPVQTLRDKLAGLTAPGGDAAGPIELQAALKGEGSERLRVVIFPAASGNHLVVSVVGTGSAGLTGEQAAQSQKLQAVGELAGGIAHDFNNLLTAIIGNSDLLLRRFRASDPAFKDLMDIKNSATRAAELVKQILAYSRRQTLRPAILKLTDVIEEFQATMGRTLGEKVKAKVQHGRDLWFVKADEGQLFQVVMNLAVNARDAMPDGGEIAITTSNVSERDSLTLKDRGLDRGEYVLCEVRDTGTGIKPEHLQKIFDPFFSTKEVGKGTGLGLSTVYGIVKQTGGTIIVDSQLGVGTTFRIYLPRYVENEDDLKVLEQKAEAPEQIADLTGKGKVLLVEDEDAVRSFASRALATRGYTVLEAASGAEALEIMDREQGQVDLVVSDVVMPEMDGPTLLRHLRERNPDIRIIFMSGYAEEAFRKNLTADEDFVFLPKPFTLKKLAETVKAAAA